jgi:hypothetical protein
VVYNVDPHRATFTEYARTYQRSSYGTHPAQHPPLPEGACICLPFANLINTGVTTGLRVAPASRFTSPT